MYKWIETNVRMRRLADGAVIPAVADNADYQEAMRWVQEGNTIQAADPPPTQDERAAFAVDATDRLVFEILYDIESRMRVLESRAAITKVQYRTALINRWKQLNP